MQAERKHEYETLIRQDRHAGIKALCLAAKAGDLAEVKQWLELDPSLINNAYLNFIPLAWAVNAPPADVFLYLLSSSANATVRDWGYTLAERIALYCQWLPVEKEAALQALAEKGVVLNPFLLAACKGGTEALSQKALSIRDARGNNVAHYASANGQLLLLLPLKAIQPNLMTSTDNGRMSPLLRAACNGQLTVVQWLLREGGAKITERDSKGLTALLWAAASGHLAVVQWLLREGGAKITERDNQGRTALTLAAQDKHANVVNWLIGEFGADPGDGMEIARQWGTYGEAQVQKARELKALFHNYYAKQQLVLNDRALAASLPSAFPKVLRGIIAEYLAPTDEEKQHLREKIAAQNDSLLTELKAHATSWKPWLSGRSLARELIDTIAKQNPCRAVTIRTAVSKFLAKHREKIVGSRLLKILEDILLKTDLLALPAAAEPVQKEPKEGEPPVVSLKEANTSELTRQPKSLPDPQLSAVAWQMDEYGGVVAFFDSKEKAQGAMILLGQKAPKLQINIGSAASSSSPTVSYSLRMRGEIPATIEQEQPSGQTTASIPQGPSEIALETLPTAVPAPQFPTSETHISSSSFFAGEQTAASTREHRKKESTLRSSRESAGSSSTSSSSKNFPASTSP